MNISVNDSAYNTLSNDSNQQKTRSISEISMYLLIMWMWMDRVLLRYFRAVILRIPLLNTIADYFIIIPYFLFIFFAIPKILQKIRFTDIVFWFIALALFLFNYIFFPGNSKILEENMINCLFLVLPLYYIGLSLDVKKMYPWLYIISSITIFAMLAQKIFFADAMSEMESMYEGDMWASYNLLPHVCLVLISMLRKPSVINVITSIVGIATLTVLGSRGPILLALLAMAIYLLIFKSHKRPVRLFIIVAVIVIILLINLNAILAFLYDFAQSVGLSVRVFEKLLDGTISSSSSRDLIAQKLISMIEKNPIIGYGLYSDRAELGVYAHNIIIELFHSFGVVFGLIILAVVVIILFRAAIISKKTQEYAILFVSLLFSGFFKLFLSGSYLEEIYFFLLIGLSVSIIRSSKKQIDEQIEQEAVNTQTRE